MTHSFFCTSCLDDVVVLILLSVVESKVAACILRRGNPPVHVLLEGHEEHIWSAKRCSKQQLWSKVIEEKLWNDLLQLDSVKANMDHG